MKRALLLALAIVFLFTFVLAGCGAKTSINPTAKDESTAEKTSAPDASKAPDTKTIITDYKESPYFGGKGLPPVKDRLPKEPKITNEMPEDQLNYEIGTYGGTLRMVSYAVDFDKDVFCGSYESFLNTPGLLGKEITGNILKGYEVSADQKEFTLHMREGLKWSDGTPVTSKDVQFAIDDVLFNKELTPIFPNWLRSGGDASGTPLKFTVVDDFTFKFAFDKPYGGFVMSMTNQSFRGCTDLLKPSTYLKKYHKKYNTDTVALEAEIKAAKFKPGEWVKLFTDKDITTWEVTGAKSIGFPVLCPWLYTKKTENTAEFERNPYYFKVDKAGNQLPYIDKIISTYVQDLEVANMKLIAGEVDFNREIATMSKMPIYKENEARGGYKVYMLDLHTSSSDVFLNLTFKNDNWRKVVQDERFRKALNLAINHKEIIDTIYFGFAEPSTFMDTTYDVAAANKLLDEMGMVKGADGFRKGPDGKKFTIPFEVQPETPDIIPVTELFVEQWKVLGLDVTMKTIDTTLWGTRDAANELQATMLWQDIGLWYEGFWGQQFWCPLWVNYFNSGGKLGEKPPADIQKMFELNKKIATEKPEDARIAATGVRAEFKAHNWYFTHLSNVKQPMIANAKIGNVAEKGFAMAVAFSMEQFFFKK